MQLPTRLETMIQIYPVGLPQSGGTLPGGEIGTKFWHSWGVSEGGTDTHTLSAISVDVNNLYEFREKATDLGPQVFAILVEAGETGERHVTTFLTESNPELASRIYALEAEIIEKYQDHIYDFHLRTIPRDDEGNPLLPPGDIYFMLTWQSPAHGNR